MFIKADLAWRYFAVTIFRCANMFFSISNCSEVSSAFFCYSDNRDIDRHGIAIEWEWLNKAIIVFSLFQVVLKLNSPFHRPVRFGLARFVQFLYNADEIRHITLSCQYIESCQFWLIVVSSLVLRGTCRSHFPTCLRVLHCFLLLNWISYFYEIMCICMLQLFVSIWARGVNTEKLKFYSKQYHCA